MTNTEIKVGDLMRNNENRWENAEAERRVLRRAGRLCPHHSEEEQNARAGSLILVTGPPLGEWGCFRVRWLNGYFAGLEETFDPTNYWEEPGNGTDFWFIADDWTKVSHGK